MNHQAVLFSFLLLQSVYTIPLNRSVEEFCAGNENSGKFFILNHLIFFTSDSEHFETFRIFNYSSGLLTSQYNASGLLPSSKSYKLLWLFHYDVDVDRCLGSQKLTGLNTEVYCARVNALKGLIIGRLASRELIFMRHNTEHFMAVHDSNNFLEIQLLIKHLDSYGYTSSLAFDQTINLFVTTHYGRHSQICLTIISPRNFGPLPLPLMEELLNSNQFQTECLATNLAYTSVIDLSGSLYALSTANTIDQIKANEVDKQFDVVQSNTAKLFFNCYGNSPILSQAQSISLLNKLDQLFFPNNLETVQERRADFNRNSLSSGGVLRIVLIILLFAIVMILAHQVLFVREFNGQTLWINVKDRFSERNDRDGGGSGEPRRAKKRTRASNQKGEGEKTHKTRRHLSRVLNEPCLDSTNRDSAIGGDRRGRFRRAVDTAGSKLRALIGLNPRVASEEFSSTSDQSKSSVFLEDFSKGEESVCDDFTATPSPADSKSVPKTNRHASLIEPLGSKRDHRSSDRKTVDKLNLASSRPYQSLPPPPKRQKSLILEAEGDLNNRKSNSICSLPTSVESENVLTSTSSSFLSTREERFDDKPKIESPPIDMVEHSRFVDRVTSLLRKYEQTLLGEETFRKDVLHMVDDYCAEDPLKKSEDLLLDNVSTTLIDGDQ